MPSWEAGEDRRERIPEEIKRREINQEEPFINLEAERSSFAG